MCTRDIDALTFTRINTCVFNECNSTIAKNNDKIISNKMRRVKYARKDIRFNVTYCDAIVSDGFFFVFRAEFLVRSLISDVKYANDNTMVRM